MPKVNNRPKKVATKDIEENVFKHTESASNYIKEKLKRFRYIIKTPDGVDKKYCCILACKTSRKYLVYVCDNCDCNYGGNELTKSEIEELNIIAIKNKWKAVRVTLNYHKCGIYDDADYFASYMVNGVRMKFVS